MNWRADILTLVSGDVSGAAGGFLGGKALAAGIWSLKTTDIREFGLGAHRAVDTRRSAAAPAW